MTIQPNTRSALAPNRNVALYHVLSLVLYCSFVNGNWIFFWTRLMSYGQLGVVDASAFGFGLFMEVPTGALADMLGKKRTMQVAMLLGALGILAMASGDTLLQLWLGFLVLQAGWAFFSGSAEALAFDSLKEQGQELLFERVLALNHRMGILMVVISTLIGGVLYNLDFRLPHYAWGFAYVLGFVVAFFVVEPKVVAEARFSLRGYFRQLGEGFRQLAQPALRRYMPLIFALLGAYVLYSFGFVQPAMAVHFGFMADAQAVVVALLGICAALAVGYVPALRQRFGDMTGLALLALMLALGLLGGMLPLGVWGFATMLLIRLAGALSSPWVSVIVNREISSEARATTLSTVSLLAKIPYVVTAVIGGEMVEAGQFGLFTSAVALFVLVMLGISLGFRKAS
ncbi:MAG: MFS transporter [Anaerolineae bacterium]